MKTYLSDVIPALKRASKKLDDMTVLRDVHWKLIDEEDNTRIVYIFRDSNELLISKNGEVEKGSWEYLGSNSILIGVGDKSYLFKQGFYNDYILGLKKDGVNEYAILINEDKIDSEIKTLKDLKKVPLLFTSNEDTVDESGHSIKKTNTSIRDDIIIDDDFLIAFGKVFFIILLFIIILVIVRFNQ